MTEHWHPFLVNHLDAPTMMAAWLGKFDTEPEARDCIRQWVDEFVAEEEKKGNPAGIEIARLVAHTLDEHPEKPAEIYGPMAIGVTACEGSSEEECNANLQHEAHAAEWAYRHRQMVRQLIEDSPLGPLLARLREDKGESPAQTGMYL